MERQIKAGMAKFMLITDEINPLFAKLWNAPARPRKDHEHIPHGPGIYLFTEADRPLYVGQTRNLWKRLGQHARPGGRNNAASFAFLLAKETARARGIEVKGTREEVETDPNFAPVFAEAKQRVAKMDVRFILLEDAHTRTVFEVYASLLLGTPFNSFETH